MTTAASFPRLQPGAQPTKSLRDEMWAVIAAHRCGTGDRGPGGSRTAPTICPPLHLSTSYVLTVCVSSRCLARRDGDGGAVCRADAGAGVDPLDRLAEERRDREHGHLVDPLLRRHRDAVGHHHLAERARLEPLDRRPREDG